MQSIVLFWGGLIKSFQLYLQLTNTNYILHLHLRFDLHLHQHQTKQVWTTNKTDSLSITDTKTNNSNINIMKFHLTAALTVLSAVPGALVSANEVRSCSCADLFLVCRSHHIHICICSSHYVSYSSVLPSLLIRHRSGSEEPLPNGTPSRMSWRSLPKPKHKQSKALRLPNLLSSLKTSIQTNLNG